MSVKGGTDTLEGRGKESACYFCNDIFEMGKLQNHLKLCGSILEQCPLRCGAWIQRKHKDTHVNECPQMEKARNAASPTHARLSDPAPPAMDHTWTPRAVPLDSCVSYLEKEVTTIKLALNEESSLRDVQASELETLRTKLVLVEERAQHFLTTLTSLRAAVDDESERAANWAAQFKHDLSNVQLALQELQSQQLNTVMRLESAVSSLVHEQRERELLEQALTHQDNRLRAITKLEEIIEYIKQTVEEERERNAENRAILELELVEARRSSQHLEQLADLRVQLQSADAAERPAIDRLAVLEVATAEVRAEASEQTSRMELVSRDLRALTKSYHKIRSELADFQTRISLDNPEFGGDNEIHLNGIGKWKGRHICGTVRMVPGPYDPLLEWPCDLSVNIVLKDQTANRSQAMDIVKSLDIRRKSSAKRHDYDSDEKTKSSETLDKGVLQMKRQYVFIPHASLDKFDYIKGDLMFLEFVVNM